MSTADEIARAVAERIAPMGDASPAIASVLSPALAKLTQQFSELLPGDTFQRIAKLLTPSEYSPEMLAEVVGSRLASCLPDEWTLAAAGLSGGEAARTAEQEYHQRLDDTPDVDDAGEQQLAPAVVRAVGDVLKSAGPEIKAAVQVLPVLSEMTAEVAALVAASGSGWGSKGPSDALRKVIEKWLGNLKKIGSLAVNTRAFVEKLQLEIEFDYSVRVPVATAVTLGGLLFVGGKDLLAGLGSTKELGTAVHKRLQRDYRSGFPMLLIEQDARVYGLRSATFRTNGVKLSEAIRRADAPDELLALHLARQSLSVLDLAYGVSGSAGLPIPPSVRKELERLNMGSIRDDNLNFNFMQVWEIKPAMRAIHGVVQEFYYRASYNLWAAILRDLALIAPDILKALGKVFAKSLHANQLICPQLFSGVLAAWPSIATARGGVLEVWADGKPNTILVTQLDALPGVVLYWNYDFPVVFAVKAFRDIRDELNKRANTYRRWVIEVYTWIIAIALAAVAVLLLLEALAAIGAEALMALLARIASLREPVLAGLKLFAEGLAAAGTSWVLVAAADANAGLINLRLVPQGPVSPDVRLVTIQVGFLQLSDVPLDSAKHLGAVFAAGFAIVDGQPESGPPPKVPVAPSG
jgi:hypothetical protein